jgi:hypothetical protein
MQIQVYIEESDGLTVFKPLLDLSFPCSVADHLRVSTDTMHMSSTSPGPGVSYTMGDVTGPPWRHCLLEKCLPHPCRDRKVFNYQGSP